LLFVPRGEFARSGGFARAVETAKEDAERAGAGEVGVFAAEDGEELVVDDLHELLAGPDARQHLRAERLLLHLFAEILRNLVIHVSGQQRQAHLAHRVGHVAFAQLAVAAQRLEDAL